jgi:hypothetical protein
MQLNTVMINIYADTEQHEFWLEQGNISSDFKIYKNINEWYDCDANTVALVEILNSVDIEQKEIVRICQHAVSAIIFIPELIDQNWLSQFDLPNVTIYVAGKLNSPGRNNGQ